MSGAVRLDARSLTLLLLGGLALIAVAAWQFLLRDQVKSYRELLASRDESAHSVALERAAVAPETLAAAEARVAELEKQIYGAGPAVPTSQMASHVIGRLDGLARDFGVRLAGVKPGAHGEVLGFAEVPFDVQVEGDYLRLMGWLGRVEGELHPMVVKRFRIEPLADAGLLRMELRVVSYRAPRLP